MNKPKKSKTSNCLKKQLHTSKTKLEIAHFIAGPDIKANRVASAETTRKIHNEYSDAFMGIGYFKVLFLYKSKMP